MTSDNAVFSSRVSGVARLLRGWTVAVFAVLLAAGGHQAAHSIMHGAADTIPFELLGFSAAITAPIAVGLAGRRISKWSTATTTVVAQIVFHALYSLPYTGAPTVQDAHAHHDLAVLTDSHAGHTMSVAGAEMVHAAATADIVMVAAHIFAAVFTTAVIVRGEQCLVTLVGWLLLAPTRLVLATQPVSIARPKRVPSLSWSWLPRPVDISQARSTRGPPVFV
ncbi:hypothetical protein [Yaniella halotolerans]|uniref:hypothetical protein n=1 Tax=Yaniella halotolerans TaxID=225453 RepID=UPI0003B5906B|nr:hypothetical protein [Yaniella halotolerans]